MKLCLVVVQSQLKLQLTMLFVFKMWFSSFFTLCYSTVYKLLLCKVVCCGGIFHFKLSLLANYLS